MSSPAMKKGISDRISIFESKSPISSSSTSAGGTTTSSGKHVATRTLSTKNFNALKSQFDKSGTTSPNAVSASGPRSLTSPPPASTSPPPPPPPRSLPPESPPPPPKKTSVASVTSVKSVTKTTKTPSPPSSGKTSPTGSSSRSSTAGRRSPPGSKPTASKASPSTRMNVTPTAKKKAATSSATTPIKNVSPSKKPATRTLSSPMNNQQQSSTASSPVGAGSQSKSTSSAAASKTADSNNKNNNNVNEKQQQQPPASPSPPPPAMVKKTSTSSVIASKEQPQTEAVIKEDEVDEVQQPKKTSISIYDKMPNIMEVSLDSKLTLETPSATSTPLSNANLNSKKPSEVVNETSHDTLDLVVNKNFINAAVTGNRYWTNQALQNDNSLKINQAMKLDLDYKEEKINSLNKEIEELQHGGATDEEVAGLKRQKADLEGRLKDQEEELDDLAGQVQMLEAAKTKLEMSMAAIKKEHRRELANKEEELEDIRAAAQKKIKVLEQQLENEHEERINFVREKHELETRIINLQEMASRSADEEQVSKLKKDLKRTKALLKDAQLMVERSRNESSNKVVLRQLKNQLEDAEFAKTAAVKAKQNLELELSDVQTQLDDIMRSKSDVEDRLMRLSREKADLSSQLEENEEELQEVMKKYKASVSQLSVDQIMIQEASNKVSDLEDERNRLKEQVAELTTRISSLEGENITNPTQSRLELKVKELESKLELEQTTRARMDTQINRLKEAIEKLNHESDGLRNKEASAQDNVRKLQRSLRELKEDYANLQQKEIEANAKKSEYEKLHELAEAETITAKNDLKLALKRIEDLQTAINGELDSESDLNSDGDSDSSEEGMENFLEHHRRAVSVQRERESMSRESMAREILQRDVRASVARESMARQLETMSEEPELRLSDDQCLQNDDKSNVEDQESQA